MNEEMQCIRCILDAGELILKSGGEISRVEDTMTRMFHAYGFLRADVFTITSSIVVTVYTKNGEILTQTRRVSGYDMNLERVHEMNQLARRFFIDVRIAVTAVHPHAFRVVCIQTVIFITLGIVESAVHAAAVYNSSITQSASFHVGVPLLCNHFGCSACKPAQINLLRPASEVMIPHQMAFCTVLLGAITILYGSSLERSRGNNVVSRTFSSPQSFIVNRSRPMPSPP